MPAEGSTAFFSFGFLTGLGRLLIIVIVFKKRLAFKSQQNSLTSVKKRISLVGQKRRFLLQRSSSLREVFSVQFTLNAYNGIASLKVCLSVMMTVMCTMMMKMTTMN